MAQVTGGRFDHLSILPFEVDKAARENGPNGRPRLRVRGWASTEQEDLDREVIHVGAFDQHLADFLRNPQMVWMHERGDTQGLWETVRPEPGRGYWVEGYMVHLGGEQDDRRFAMVEEGLVRGLSVGFNGQYTQDYGYWDGADEAGYPTRESRWHWTKNCRLMEVSLCNIPCNPSATMELAKAAGLQIVTPETFQVKSVVPYQNLPLAPEETGWDAAAALRRVARWAGGPDKADIDWARYRRAFVWYDSADSENFGAYKLPIADVIDGELQAVWRGVAASMAALLGSRGGVDIPEEDREGVYNHLVRYYKRFEKEPPELKGFGEPVLWKADEQDIFEECRALEDVERLRSAATSLSNITRHWQREGGAPSAAVVASAVSAITAATGIVKAAEALSEATSAELQRAADMLGDVLGKRPAPRVETDDKDLVLRITR